MKSKTNRIVKQVNLWTFSAVSLPLIALAGLFFLKFIGFDNWIDKALVIGSVTFFTISVIWWWWALSKIAYFAEVIDRVNEKFVQVKEDVSKIREDL